MKIRIERDQDPESPREFDNLGVVVCFHRRYKLGDKHELRNEDFSDWDELEEHLTEECGAVGILPLYLYDHGGITINTTGFSCPWDSGQIGFIYATKETLETAGVAEENIEAALKGEVHTYDQYLTGDVWGYVIEDDDGEHIDSCWGFYGREYTEQEAKGILQYHEDNSVSG